jgi:hypothetical protein
MRPRLILSAAPADTTDAQYVDISPVALPIVYNRKLVNYIFVQVRLNLARNVDAAAMREKEPYFRDALVRLAHRRPFTRPDNFTVVDEGALRTALAAEAAKIAGPRAIVGVQVVNQTPRRRSGLPRPPQAPQARTPAAAAH